MANIGAMKRLLLLPLLMVVATCDHEPPVTGPRPTNSQRVSVLTQHNDNDRSGLNANETLLTASNVNVQRFGTVFRVNVDDQVYAQPLVVANVPVDDGRNVVYVATVNNTVYAFDGDDGKLYWQKSYSQPGMRPPRNTDMTGACGGGYQDFSGNMGIVGTPVIDGARGVMYFVARSMTGSTYVQFLHAVDILTGNDVTGSPVPVTATYAGNGDGSINNVITFDPRRQNQRQALTLVNGTVYISWSSHCDWGPYHGWIMGYDATTLAQKVVYNATPTGAAGGMWQSGMGLAADAQGNLYAATGNGTVGVGNDPTQVINRGESALKLTPSGSMLQVASWFTPNNYVYLNNVDLDFGGMGSLLIPGSSFYFTSAKDGTLYLLNRDDMGGFQQTSNRVQQMVYLNPSANLHCQAAYYRGSAKEFVYVWSENDPLRALPFDRTSNLFDVSGQIRFTQGGPMGQSGAVLSVSSNGTTDGTGILWASYAFVGDAEHDVSPGILRAFDASDITRELWNNRQNFARDGAGSYAKFSSPTIANGKVYLATFAHQIVVYGLLP